MKFIVVNTRMKWAVRFLAVVAFVFPILSPLSRARAEDGYDLWLRYAKVENQNRLSQYENALESAVVLGASPTSDASGSY